jgi:hypothetical protein
MGISLMPIASGPPPQTSTFENYWTFTVLLDLDLPSQEGADRQHWTANGKREHNLMLAASVVGVWPPQASGPGLPATCATLVLVAAALKPLRVVSIAAGLTVGAEQVLQGMSQKLKRDLRAAETESAACDIMARTQHASEIEDIVRRMVEEQLRAHGADVAPDACGPHEDNPEPEPEPKPEPQPEPEPRPEAESRHQASLPSHQWVRLLVQDESTKNCCSSSSVLEFVRFTMEFMRKNNQVPTSVPPPTWRSSGRAGDSRPKIRIGGAAVT